MRKQLLHPATLIATIALAFALGVPAQAAKLIDGKSIKPGTVTTRQIKDGAIAKADLSKKLLATFGRRGPRGKAGATFHCPSGTVLIGVGCIELAQRDLLKWYAARTACRSADRRLPTLAELTILQTRTDLGVPTVGSEWTDGLSLNGSVHEAVTLTFNSGIPDLDTVDGLYNFRCVASPTFG